MNFNSKLIKQLALIMRNLIMDLNQENVYLIILKENQIIKFTNIIYG